MFSSTSHPDATVKHLDSRNLKMAAIFDFRLVISKLCFITGHYDAAANWKSKLDFNKMDM